MSEIRASPDKAADDDQQEQLHPDDASSGDTDVPQIGRIHEMTDTDIRTLDKELEQLIVVAEWSENIEAYHLDIREPGAGNARRMEASELWKQAHALVREYGYEHVAAYWQAKDDRARNLGRDYVERSHFNGPVDGGRTRDRDSWAADLSQQIADLRQEVSDLNTRLTASENRMAEARAAIVALVNRLTGPTPTPSQPLVATAAEQPTQGAPGVGL